MKPFNFAHVFRLFDCTVVGELQVWEPLFEFNSLHLTRAQTLYGGIRKRAVME